MRLLGLCTATFSSAFRWLSDLFFLRQRTVIIEDIFEGLEDVVAFTGIYRVFRGRGVFRRLGRGYWALALACVKYVRRRRCRWDKLIVLGSGCVGGRRLWGWRLIRKWKLGPGRQFLMLGD